MKTKFNITDVLDTLNLKCGVQVEALAYENDNEILYRVTKVGENKLKVLLEAQLAITSLITSENN